MDRRDFVRLSCTVCIAAGAGLMVGSLSSCGAAVPVINANISNNQIAVPTSAFDQNAFQIVKPANFHYNIGLLKETNGTYTALLLRCTHHENALTATGNGFLCSMHGSQFDREGNVTKGPAERNLKKYETQIIDNQIIIKLS